MKKAPPPTATELMGQKPPPSHPRKLTLKFFGKERPQLDRAEFYCEETTTPGYWQQKARDGDHSIAWTRVPQAVSLIFLDYVSASLQGSPGRLRFSGERTSSLAASLGDAICKGEGKLYKLFVQFPKNGGEYPRVRYVFDGRNVAGKRPGERYLWVRTDYLPFEAVEIFWDAHRIKDQSQIEKLAGQIRKVELVGNVL